MELFVENWLLRKLVLLISVRGKLIGSGLGIDLMHGMLVIGVSSRGAKGSHLHLCETKCSLVLLYHTEIFVSLLLRYRDDDVDLRTEQT